MKLDLLKYLALLALLALAAGAARAQCPTTPLPAGCAASQVFQVFDGATGQEVQALCVGRPVRFAPGCGRVVAADLLYYTVQATTGLVTTTIDCHFTTNNNTYTPTAAGFVTIAELANPAVSGALGTLYARNLPVYDSPAPSIALTPCSNNQVRIDHNTISNNHYDQYYVQVGGGPLTGPLAPGFRLMTTAPAGTPITVIGGYRDNALCTNQITQSVPTRTALPLAITRLAVRSPLPGPVDFTFSGFTDYYLKTLQYAPAATPTQFRVVTGFGGSPTTTSLSLAAGGQYRLARYDICGQDSAFSAPVPTLELSAASVSNVNTLSWQAGGPVASYALLRDGAVLATLPASASTYADAAVSCGTRYAYQLQAATASGSQSVSNAVAVQTVSTLAPPAPLVLASFDLQNRVELAATLPSGAALPPGGTVVYSRQGGGQALTLRPPAAPATLRDSTALAALLADPPCYSATLRDMCGNTSAPGPATCPVLLAVAAADPLGTTASLSWAALRGPGSPGAAATYRVLTLAADGTVLATSAATAALTYLDARPPADRQILRYRVEATGAGLPAGRASYSNVATLVRQPVLAVPNAFTPNGDGLNDVLEVKGRYLAAFVFVVVDRNGQEVFRGTDRGQAWDGTIRGHAPVNAAYVWRFTMTDEAGQPFSRTGSVSIVK